MSFEVDGPWTSIDVGCNVSSKNDRQACRAHNDHVVNRYTCFPNSHDANEREMSMGSLYIG
jgi:hypothetical protein